MPITNKKYLAFLFMGFLFVFFCAGLAFAQSNIITKSCQGPYTGSTDGSNEVFFVESCDGCGGVIQKNRYSGFWCSENGRVMWQYCCDYSNTVVVECNVEVMGGYSCQDTNSGGQLVPE